MIKKSLKEKFVDFLYQLLAVATVVLVICFLIAVFKYPIFLVMLFVTIIVSMITVECIMGYFGDGVDFLGTGLYPYVGISSGTYLMGFTALLILRRLEFTDLEVNWQTLGVLALFSVLTSCVVCWAWYIFFELRERKLKRLKK